MAGEFEGRRVGVAARLGLPPRNPVLFATSFPLCAAVVFATLGVFTWWVSGMLVRGPRRLVVHAFVRVGIPGEPEPRVWLAVTAAFLVLAVCCLAGSVVAGRSAAHRKPAGLLWAASGEALATVFLMAAAGAMHNVVRWFLVFNALCWLWAVFGYIWLARSFVESSPGAVRQGRSPAPRA